MIPMCVCMFRYIASMNTEGGASALEQFVLLAKIAKGRACVALIQQVRIAHLDQHKCCCYYNYYYLLLSY